MRPITKEALALLNSGQIEARNLMETLAIDFNILASQAFPEFKINFNIDSSLGITKRMTLAGQFFEDMGQPRLLDKLVTHPSDTVRSWACYWIARMDRGLDEKLSMMQPLADDEHFGVREWAWLALRPGICQAPHEAILWLGKWVSSSSYKLRRFACEATRPRGVWCAHIPLLKDQPELGLPILEALKWDEHKYVSDSVGNWLNDAAKTKPDWVVQLCSRWQDQPNKGNPKVFARMIKRATRSL
jgi:3-methyladenine DNA glycosylase AlkC